MLGGEVSIDGRIQYHDWLNCQPDEQLGIIEIMASWLKLGTLCTTVKN